MEVCPGLRSSSRPSGITLGAAVDVSPAGGAMPELPGLRTSVPAGRQRQQPLPTFLSLCIIHPAPAGMVCISSFAGTEAVPLFAVEGDADEDRRAFRLASVVDELVCPV